MDVEDDHELYKIIAIVEIIISSFLFVFVAAAATSRVCISTCLPWSLGNISNNVKNVAAHFVAFFVWLFLDVLVLD